MNPIQCLGCALIVICFASCQTQKDTAKSSSTISNPVYDPAPPANTFESLFHHSGFSQLHLMMQRDGEKMMCVQPAYQVCFDRSKEMCEIETDQWVFSCLSNAKNQVPNVYDKITRDQFMGAFGACMINQHAFSRPDEIEAISKCMVNAEIDETLAIKELVKGKNLYQPTE